MIRDPKPASRSMPQNLRKAFPALAATVDERQRRNDRRCLADSQCEDIRDLHALCVPAVEIARELKLPQALVVNEIECIAKGQDDD